MKLTLPEARRLAIAAQGLDGTWRLPPGRQGAVRAIDRLGFVQIDTIAVIERAHHHVLQTRLPDYRPQMLADLLADRKIFEYWAAPAAAYVPMADFRWYLPRMQWERESKHQNKWLADNKAMVEHILARIRAEGALASSDFESEPRRKRDGWWDWKPPKRALEILYNRGQLMVSARRNFQRLYDLAERVLPAGIDTSMPTRADSERFAIQRYLSTHGIATAREIRWASHHGGRGDVLKEMIAGREVLPVEIEGLAGQTYYALGSPPPLPVRRENRGRAERDPDLSGAGVRVDASDALHILSPFDSFVHRQRLRDLFGFDYRLECYVPQPKRRHGYFCLPILYGNRLVGRLDPKADRASRCFIVRRLILEPRIPMVDGLLAALAGRLRQFAAFNGCDAVEIHATAPAKLRRPLQRHLTRP